jgi:magnesium chelatase subunit H
MPRRTSAADRTPVRVVIVTLDDHLASTVDRAAAALRGELPGIEVRFHAAADWERDEARLARVVADIGDADIVLATMLFMDEHIRAVRPALEARRARCDAMVVCMSAAEVTKLTRMGRFAMGATDKGPMAFLKRLRGKDSAPNAGARQLRMLKLIPKVLRFVPGTAQDLRAYFLTLQYWLAGSEENVRNLIRLLVARYADGPRRPLREATAPRDPVEYPDVGLYHPALEGRVTTSIEELPNAPSNRGTVGLLVMRSYVLAGNVRHYDGVIDALERRGYRVVPAFSSGLDARPAIDRYFKRDGRAAIDALVSLTGFSLVGGPAYNNAKAAEEALAQLDVPSLAAHPVEFQTLDEWATSERGLMPVESTIMVAIPELDGSSGPMVFGGRASAPGAVCAGCERGCAFPADQDARDMQHCAERAEMLAARVDRLIVLRRKTRAERRLAIVLFNFPPNAGKTGTAAFLDVFESLRNTLAGLAEAGYLVEVPASADALRARLLGGNAARFGTDANVYARVPCDDHVRREPWLREIETQWGPAPGRHQSDGGGIFVLGERFGNVFVGVQPAFGYEGDPMRLLFERSFTPTHAFSAFYRWLREDFRADAALHFGTHGALEFMPGKQVGMSRGCWPDRLIADLPNVYLYAANNPSEGTIAKRRAAATLVSYLTPPIAYAGLYRGLVDLKAAVDRRRSLDAAEERQRADLAASIQAQAAALDLAAAEPPWGDDADRHVARLATAILELEYTLIPHGMHIVGEPLSAPARIDMLTAMAEGRPAGERPSAEAIAALIAGATPEGAAGSGGEPRLVQTLRELAAADAAMAVDHEIPAIVRALDGRYVRPVAGGDPVRNPAVLPTGRNLHGFDPFRIPSSFAMADGARQAARLIARHLSDGHRFPESVALVLWGTDTLKTEGGPVAQALALVGAKPRFDGYGRLAGAELVPLAELDRPRIDVVLTLSGIFRDLLPLQTRLLAEASLLAATSDEPPERNFVRKHALEMQRTLGCDMETAALRVFSNADGAYGANVNHFVENGRWQDEDELAEVWSRRKCFAYGRDGRAAKNPRLLEAALRTVDLTYQNLDSVELGVTSLDQYFDTLGGVSRAAARAGGGARPVYVGDQTRGEGKVRSLAEQVGLETRTRMLNPKWTEGMLKHGHEGVRQIEAHVTNIFGWSATTGEVAPWIYQRVAETYVLDAAMRERLAALNPRAAAKMANRLMEAHDRKYWEPDEATIAALQDASEDLEDRLEGVAPSRAAAGVAA